MTTTLPGQHGPARRGSRGVNRPVTLDRLGRSLALMTGWLASGNENAGHGA